MKAPKFSLILLSFLLFIGVFAGGCDLFKDDSETPAISPPAAPIGVTVIGGKSKATLNWTSTAGATSYNLYYAVSSSGATPVSGTKVTGVNAPCILALDNGTKYYIVVTAVGPGGESQPSDVVSVIPAVLVPEDYSTIQAAIDDTAAGPAIRVTVATHVEGGQIVAGRNVLVFSTGSSKSEIQPAADLPQTNNVAGAWILVKAGVEFQLDNVVLNGNGKKMYQGLRSHGTAKLSNVDFRNIRTTASPYYGIAVLNYGGTIAGGAGSDTHGSGGAASSMTVTNCTFQNIGRIGVLTKGTGATTTISDSSYTGMGAGDWLDYAYEAGAGGTLFINGNNVISNNIGVASVDGSTSAGVLVTTYYGTGTTATINGVTFSNCTDDIAVGYDGADTSVVAAHYNKFSGIVSGITSTAPTVDAINNWWNDITGPTHSSNPDGKGVGVSDKVNFTPWCTSAAGCTSKECVRETKMLSRSIIQSTPSTTARTAKLAPM